MPRSRWIVKPPGGIPLGTSPLASELAGAWLFNEQAGSGVRDMVRNSSATFATNLNLKPTWDGDRYGQTVFNNTDDGSVGDAINRSYIQVDADYPSLKPTGSLSVAVGYRLRHTPRNTGTWGGGYCLAAKDGNTAGWILDLYTVTGPGPRWICHIGGSFTSIQVTDATFTNGNGLDHSLVGTYNKTSGVMTLYMDGLSRGTASPGSAGIDDNTNPVQFLARTASTLPGYMDGWLRYGYVWNRELSQAEAQMLVVDPYAPARRPSQVKYGSGQITVTAFRRTLSGLGTRTGSRQRHF